MDVGEYLPVTFAFFINISSHVAGFDEKKIIHLKGFLPSLYYIRLH